MVEYVKRKLSGYTYQTSYSISETSMTTFARELLSKASVSGSYGSKFLGGSVKASASASIDVRETQQQETYFTEYRNDYTFATWQMPLTVGEHVFESDIKELVEPYFLEQIQGLQNLGVPQGQAMADQIVSSAGIAFASQVTFGGSFDMSSLVKAEKWMTSTAVKASVDASYKAAMGSNCGSVTASHSIEITDGKQQSTAEFTTHNRGGDFSVYTDQVAWKQSVENDPVIASYGLIPIYELLSPLGSYPHSRLILEAAVERAVTGFDKGIPNFSIKPTIMQVVPILSGYRYSRDLNTSPTYTADPPEGFKILGSGYGHGLGMSAVLIDGVNAKENTGWKLVWDDKGTGWNGRLSIWIPTMVEDLKYKACGLTTVSNARGHNGYDQPSHKVAMLNEAVTEEIYGDFFPPLIGTPLKKVGWPNYRSQNPWQASLFYIDIKDVYAPIWEMFKPLPNDTPP